MIGVKASAENFWVESPDGVGLEDGLKGWGSSGCFVVEAVEQSVVYFLPADLPFGCGVVALAL